MQQRPRQLEGLGVAELGQPRQRRAAGIAEPEQLRRLVEGLAGGVVDGLAEQLVAADVVDAHQLRVAAGHEQRDERKLGRIGDEERRQQVAFEVVHAEHRPCRARRRARRRRRRRPAARRPARARACRRRRRCRRASRRPRRAPRAPAAARAGCGRATPARARRRRRPRASRPGCAARQRRCGAGRRQRRRRGRRRFRRTRIRCRGHASERNHPSKSRWNGKRCALRGPRSAMRVAGGRRPVEAPASRRPFAATSRPPGSGTTRQAPSRRRE